MRRPPESMPALLAVVLGGMGILFGLLGSLISLLKLPMRSGQGWMFLPIGAALLLAGAGCALEDRRRRRLRERLLREGTPVPGTLVSMRRHWLITWNASAFNNWPGKSSPWSLTCRYSWQGKDYLLRTGFLWARPAPERSAPVVYLDPDNPRRAVVDPETITLTL